MSPASTSASACGAGQGSNDSLSRWRSDNSCSRIAARLYRLGASVKQTPRIRLRRSVGRIGGGPSPQLAFDLRLGAQQLSGQPCRQLVEQLTVQLELLLP